MTTKYALYVDLKSIKDKILEEFNRAFATRMSIPALYRVMPKELYDSWKHVFISTLQYNYNFKFKKMSKFIDSNCLARFHHLSFAMFSGMIEDFPDLKD